MTLRALPFLFLLVGCTADEAPRPQTKIAFIPTEVHATRTAFRAECAETNPTFTDEDIFSLQPIDDASPNGLNSVAVMFMRRVTRNVPLHLTIGRPVFGIPPGPGHTASAEDPRIGAGVIVTPKTAQKRKTLAKAVVTVLAVPTKDGEPLSAHVALEFTDGDVLDETFTGALVTGTPNCSTGE